jgi:hypothetical protein
VNHSSWVFRECSLLHDVGLGSSETFENSGVQPKTYRSGVKGTEAMWKSSVF